MPDHPGPNALHRAPTLQTAVDRVRNPSCATFFLCTVRLLSNRHLLFFSRIAPSSCRSPTTTGPPPIPAVTRPPPLSPSTRCRSPHGRRRRRRLPAPAADRQTAIPANAVSPRTIGPYAEPRRDSAAAAVSPSTRGPHGDPRRPLDNPCRSPRSHTHGPQREERRRRGPELLCTARPAAKSSHPGTSSIFVRNCSQGLRKASAPLVKLLPLLNFQRSGACSSCSLVKFSYQLIHLFSKICSTLERIKEMGQVLSRDLLYDCKAITEHLRAMLLLADEEIRSLKKQSTFHEPNNTL